MKRSIVLALLVGMGAVWLAVGAAQDGPMEIEVEQLEDNLYVLRGQGGGGNTAVFVTADGVVVVDSKNPGWGAPILETIREITDNPVRTLINTHSHHDHVSGNVAFADVQFVAHETTKANMEVMRPYTGQTEPPVDVFAESDGHGLPTVIFSDRMSLGSGDDRVDLYHFGRGHTGGDAWVAFPALRTLHAGDVFLGQRVPFLDAENGGSGVDIPDTLQKAHDNIGGIDTIITGHSGQMTWSDLNEWAAFNRDFLRVVRDGRAEGRSVDEIAEGWSLPEAYSHYDPPNAAGVRRNIQVIVDELEEHSRITLQGVEVELLEDGRLVLGVADGRSYELVGLRVLEQCEGSAGPWACGEAARQVLQEAVRGEKLDCLVFEDGDRSAVECMAQTRNLNLWLVRRAGVELAAEWRDRPEFSRYREADQSGRAMRDLARAVAETDPLQVRSRGSSASGRVALVDPVADDAPRKTVALGERAERRGATVGERAIIADGLPEDGIRAGVWDLTGLRVIVGEDIESCLQYIWCAFAVVDAGGNVVVSGTARGAPRVADRDGLEPLVLVWQEPGGAWQQWSR